MTIHFDEPFLTLHWDDATQIVWAEWKNTVGGEPMRRGLEVGLQLIIDKGARRWLADTRALGNIDPADVKWINDEWIPRAVAAGICWMSFVTPKRVVMQLAVKSFMSRINDREIGNAYFDSLDEARSWLAAQP